MGHGGQRGYKHFKTKPRVSCRDEFNESLCLALLCWCWRHAACIPPGTDSACSDPKLKGRLHSAHTGSMFPITLWESPCSKIQRLSSGDFRTPVRGQAVKQSAMMRSALEFFATAQLCCERSLESVNSYRASHGDDGPPLQGQDSGKSSYVQWAFRQLWRIYGVGLHPRNFSSVFRFSAYPAFHRMVLGWDSDEIAEYQHKFFMFLSLF